MKRNQLKNSKRIIIKIGTSLLTKKDGKLNVDYIRNITKQILKLKKEVILVTSGAIGAGVRELGIKKTREVTMQQVTAAVGQALLMHEYKKAFGKQKIAQVLITNWSFIRREAYLNLRNTLDRLLKLGIIPIINENDVISTAEIGDSFGDNDKLSALVASKIEADLLILLTDTDGLCDKDPRCFKDAKVIPTIEEITEDVVKGAGKASVLGKGGMTAKVKAGKICMDSGVTMVIANGNIENVIEKVLSGKNIGTIFIPKNKISNKKRWIKFSPSQGKIIVDEGAKNALLKGKNLLPAGILDVKGDFLLKEIVDIVFNNKVFAKALVDYSAEDLRKIKGKKSSEIKKILSNNNYENVTRRENLIVM